MSEELLDLAIEQTFTAQQIVGWRAKEYAGMRIAAIIMKEEQLAPNWIELEHKLKTLEKNPYNNHIKVYKALKATWEGNAPASWWEFELEQKKVWVTSTAIRGNGDVYAGARKIYLWSKNGFLDAAGLKSKTVCYGSNSCYGPAEDISVPYSDGYTLNLQ
jgi:hypothetical protein